MTDVKRSTIHPAAPRRKGGRAIHHKEPRRYEVKTVAGSRVVDDVVEVGVAGDCDGDDLVFTRRGGGMVRVPLANVVSYEADA
jgi:hypothetical protein